MMNCGAGLSWARDCRALAKPSGEPRSGLTCMSVMCAKRKPSVRDGAAATGSARTIPAAAAREPVSMARRVKGSLMAFKDNAPASDFALRVRLGSVITKLVHPNDHNLLAQI